MNSQRHISRSLPPLNIHEKRNFCACSMRTFHLGQIASVVLVWSLPSWPFRRVFGCYYAKRWNFNGFSLLAHESFLILHFFCALLNRLLSYLQRNFVTYCGAKTREPFDAKMHLKSIKKARSENEEPQWAAQSTSTSIERPTNRRHFSFLRLPQDNYEILRRIPKHIALCPSSWIHFIRHKYLCRIRLVSDGRRWKCSERGKKSKGETSQCFYFFFFYFIR